MADILYKRAPEDWSGTITLNAMAVSTSGLTLTGYFIGDDGTENSIGTASGVAAAANAAITADLAALARGRYEFRVEDTNGVAHVPNQTYSAVIFDVF